MHLNDTPGLVYDAEKNDCTGFMDIKKCNFCGPKDNGLNLLQLLLLMLAATSLIMHNYIVPISYELWAIKTLIHFNKILIFSFSLSCSISLCFLCPSKWYKSVCSFAKISQWKQDNTPLGNLFFCFFLYTSLFLSLSLLKYTVITHNAWHIKSTLGRTSKGFQANTCIKLN